VRAAREADDMGSDEPPSISTGSSTSTPPHPRAPDRRKIIGRGVMLLVTGVSLYIVAPSLIELFGDIPKLADVFPLWFVPILVLESLAFVSIWVLMGVALRSTQWFDIACAQLTGNALSRALPGGAATGGATQYEMLTRAGFRGTRTTTALTAVGLLSTLTLFTLPLLALPAMFFGLAVDSRLLSGAIVAAILAVILLSGSSVLLISNRVVGGIGGMIDWVVTRIKDDTPEPPFATRLVTARNYVRTSLAESWHIAVPAAFGNQLFDYGALLVSVYAIGASADPALVLLAFVVASTLAMIPLTPGGLGFVEAGLTGMLTLAGLTPAEAVLSTLLYRLFSYWLPLPAGAIASYLFGRRHRRHRAAA
jgi:uncharacterized protein (TIRG00374 family)